ncbi:MAG: DegT/DnrJ/EryC1/StrS aminotransferase family protein [Thermaerobacter sp.]|nr:DegT/DnrJ/EryC1/StrS aminotransferase family protein [Thermaerobacter sp.]
MRETFLPYNLPEVGDDEAEAVLQTIRSRWITRGPLTGQFEEALSEYLGGARVVALSSCTAGLHLALLAAGIGPGDEVITTPYTFAASVNVIMHVGATPVLADIEEDTGNLDPNLAEAAITSRTRAIMPVHFAGHPADMEAFNELRDRYGVRIVEDGAHALASASQGRKVGTFGNLTAFSFYATKNLTTGEGGALVVPEAEMADRIRVLSLHGLSQNAWNRYSQKGSWHYDVKAPGFKFNMTDIEAAMGLRQLNKLDAMQNRRTALADRLSRGLAGLPVVLPTARPGVSHAWHLYPLRLRLDQLDGDRSQLIEALQDRNIGTSVHFIPIHFHSYYQSRMGWKRGQFPRAEAFFEAEVSLPLYPAMSFSDADDVAAAVRDVLTPWLR